MKNTRGIFYHVSVYGAGQLLRGLSSLLLLPIYTRFLSPADYGLVELVSAIVDLFALVLGLRIGAAVFKHHADAPDAAGKRAVISTAVAFLATASGVGAMLIALLADHVAQALDAPADFAPALRLFALTLVFSAINETFFVYLRILDRSLLYVAFSLTRFLGQFVLSVVFIVLLDLGYWGVVWAALLSSATVAAVFGTWLWPRVGWRVDARLVRRLAGFSAPIMVASLGMYFVSFGNRYLLELHVGFAAVGIYALAYKFGLTYYNLFWTSFATYWSARQYDYARRADAPDLFGRIFLTVNLVLLPAAAAVVVATPPFLRLVAAEAFWPAIEVVPWVVCASLLLCWTDFFRIGSLRASRTGHFAKSALLAAAVAMVLYQLWIPERGATGAAMATCAAHAVHLLYTFTTGQRLFRVVVPWWRLAVAVSYFGSLCFLVARWQVPDLPGLFLKPALMVVASPVLVLVVPLFPDVRKALLAAIGIDATGLSEKRATAPAQAPPDIPRADPP